MTRVIALGEGQSAKRVQINQVWLQVALVAFHVLLKNFDRFAGANVLWHVEQFAPPSAGVPVLLIGGPVLKAINAKGKPPNRENNTFADMTSKVIQVPSAVAKFM